ncbi:MAG: C10 family peptidase [Bacteroidaceae bacterium]|nr:C10 family peptidase [Bacteroidaceae bacterium]
MKGLLRTAATVIVCLLTLSTATFAQKKAAATEAEYGNIVVYLETAKWDQTSPYNNLCRTYDGRTALTGCVPTAYAILMQYHKWPESAEQKKVYHSGTGESITLGNKYDWENMLSSYRNGYTEEQATAVATLMRDLGWAYGVEYGTGNTASGAGGEGAGKLIEIFKYKSESPNTSSATMATSRDILANDELWVQYIKESLDAGCPIPYSSTTTSGGRHIFILDGYTDKGYFHFNWGWGGQGNGWFKLDEMKPDSYSDYSKSHKAYFMLKPDKPNDIEDGGDNEGDDNNNDNDNNESGAPAEVTIKAEATTGGTASVNSDKETVVPVGKILSLLATPDEGYTFTEWRVGNEVVSTDAFFSTTAQNDRVYTAVFIENSGTVTIEVKGSGGYMYVGSGTDRKQEVATGSTAFIRAQAAEGTGKKFAYWSTGNTMASGKGTIFTNENPYSFTVTEDVAFYANFVAEDTDLNVTIETAATTGGKATVYGDQKQTIALGSKLILEAKADNGYHFVNWTRGTEVVSTEPVYNTVAREDVTITANFESLGNTGIKDVETVKENAIFDLSGRKVENIEKEGVYIINGKTILRR